jgi:hypothetical protein
MTPGDVLAEFVDDVPTIPLEDRVEWWALIDALCRAGVFDELTPSDGRQAADTIAAMLVRFPVDPIEVLRAAAFDQCAFLLADPVAVLGAYCAAADVLEQFDSRGRLWPAVEGVRAWYRAVTRSADL